MKGGIDLILASELLFSSVFVDSFLVTLPKLLKCGQATDREPVFILGHTVRRAIYRTVDGSVATETEDSVLCKFLDGIAKLQLTAKLVSRVKCSGEECLVYIIGSQSSIHKFAI